MIYIYMYIYICTYIYIYIMYTVNLQSDHSTSILKSRRAIVCAI